MFWIHRIGNRDHFDASWDLLDQKNMLSIGWYDWAFYSKIVEAVRNRNEDQIRNLAYETKNSSPQDATQVVNFSNMQQGDHVIVLPIENYDPRFFIVEIESTKTVSVLELPTIFQSGFFTSKRDSSGKKIGVEKIDYVDNLGFYYADRNPIDPVDVGFFFKVDIIARLVKDSMSQEFKDLCNFPQTNRKVEGTLEQKIIYDSLPKDVQLKIPSP